LIVSQAFEKETFMLVLKSKPSAIQNNAPQESVDYARRQLTAAVKGELQLLELEKMRLSEKEVAKFIMGRIPIIRAAALAGRYTGIGLFLEEMYVALAKKTENA
jgi:hypothetical protein